MYQWFEERLDPFPPVSLEQPPRGLVPFCLHFTRGAWPYIICAGLLMMLIAITEVWLFSFIGNIVDWLAVQSRETFVADQKWALIGMAALVLIALPVFVILHSLVTFQSLLGNYPMRIRWLVHNYLLNQSMSFYQDEFAGRIATKLMQTALAVREVVIKLVDVLNYVSVYFIGTVVIVASADWRLALPLLVWLCLYILLLRYFVPRLGRVAEAQADARSVMTGRIVDSYTNIQTVKLFSHAQRESSYAKEGMSEFLTTVHTQMRLVTKLYASLYLLNSLLLFAVGYLAIHLWLEAAISVGAIAVALSLVLRLWGMSQWIMWEVSALFENIGTVQDGMQTVSVPRLIEDQPNAQDLQVTAGSVQFDHVNFFYAEDKPVLKNFNLTIQAGEKIGLVGRSGAGKSTLVNVLLRFYDLQSGKICIDGQDISTITQESLRQNIGMVTQDTSLLHRSVRGNIAYGRPDATDTMIEEAARRAEADVFIPELSDAKGRRGFDAHVGERGVKLSGGQRQRIAIARVMLKDAPILILDEATSALDSEVEAAIQENLYRLMEGKTVIAIAHRLSTIAAMDRLIVLDEGQIVEQGTHAELLEQNGIYAQLWQHQSGGFLTDD
ncbi:MAG TPA: ABC transporter ATP-binding protein [Pseudidiomarina sp.]|nr:ABC transporter ATP-binding protein [Pseudidiomarina sp.]